LGFLGISQVCKDILNSIYVVLDGVDDYTKDFLYALRKPTHLIDTLKAIVTTEVFV